jgi:hypothetical protein
VAMPAMHGTGLLTRSLTETGKTGRDVWGLRSHEGRIVGETSDGWDAQGPPGCGLVCL